MNSVVEHAAMFGLGSKMVKRAPEASPSVTFSHLRPNIAYILFHDSDHVINLYINCLLYSHSSSSSCTPILFTYKKRHGN